MDEYMVLPETEFSYIVVDMPRATTSIAYEREEVIEVGAR